MKKNKNYRTINMRLSAVNILKQDNDVLGLKTGDVFEYKKDDIIDILEKWSTTKDIKYFLCEHNEDIKNVHFHIVITFPQNSVCSFDTIKSKFPYGFIDNCRHSVKACVQYLIHMNDFDKYQYSWDEVVTNSPYMLEIYKTPGKATMDAKTKHIIEKILKGELKEFEIDKIDPEVYIKNKRKIKDAFEYYIKKVQMNPNRNINVIVLQGEPGTGKTTFCKVYAEKNNKSICFSSASNDPWQDYCQEDIFVYDDFNFESIKIEDLLKVLDPNNGTSIGARYKNRFFTGDTIFICTNVPVTEWYFDAWQSHREALYRRISCVLNFYFNKFNDNKQTCYTINDVVDSGGWESVLGPTGLVVKTYAKMELKQREEGFREFDVKKYIKVDDENKADEFINYLDSI